MKPKERSPILNREMLLRTIFGVLLTVGSVAVFFAIHMRYYTYATRLVVRGNSLLLLMYTVLLIMILHLYGAYRIRYSRTRELVLSYALASFIENVLAYMVLSLIARRLLPVGDIILVFVIQCFGALLLYVLGRVMLPMLLPTIPALFIHPAGEWNEDVASKFDRRRSSYAVTGEAGEDLPRRELLRTIENYGAVVLGPVSAQTRQVVIGYCYRTGIKVLLVPDMTDIMVASAQPMVVKDYLMYDLNTQGGDAAYYIAKRGLDILVSGLSLLILSPIMLLVALAVKLQDGGPVFYRQVRLTRGGKEFKLIKFRSMIVNAEKATGAVLAGKRDDRITPVGRFIRATRLDELPQLWNIFIGDMTLVGPRPERPEFYQTICDEYPEFNYRLMVKAGLTGYAQLYGKYNTSFPDKARLDMYYIQHASFFWDIQLILYTLKIIFTRESTEGVEVQEETHRDSEFIGSGK